MLSTPWSQRKPRYDIVVIGSGYGGAIAAARLAAANLSPKPSVCILERGREWQPGEFPETLAEGLAQTRSNLNPLGLYELLTHPEISVIKGSGLGGTSLINANVAIVPDREVFEQFNWPSALTFDNLAQYYQRAHGVLAANPHPRALELAKVRALARRGSEIGIDVKALDIAVNFKPEGVNPYGVHQKPCVDCGNCVSGCNHGAKNTLAMNYLPMAKNAGATILTQNKVEWIEKLSSGGWRIHGRHVESAVDSQTFTLDAGEVILSAGSLNSTEILLRSEMHGLAVSPALGTKFSGNGDFFGVAYNGDYETDVLGYSPNDQPGAGESPFPGPSIVGMVRYSGGLPESQRVSIQDLSFPSLYTEAVKAVFGLIGGDHTVTGNETAQLDRAIRDRNPLVAHDANGAMNHSMLYLVMGHDNARGVILFEAPFTEPDGRIRISWDQAGQQQIFSRMNLELRRHAHALGANFISNPTWSMFNVRHLVTAHPLGGAPMGDDYLQGAVDPFGRVFAGDGAVHQGLYVSDGALIPSALGVNPFLTISALAERFAELRIQNAYPQPKTQVSMAGAAAIDAIEVAGYNQGQLETLFRRWPTLGIGKLVNAGSAPEIDLASQTIRNDRYWKGFFPKGHVLNAMSAALFTGFKKAFHKQDGAYTGVTSDTDGRINVRNSLEEITVGHADGGTLEAGEYILLRYLDAPWQGFYDVFKIISDDLMIGRVYLGEYPHGARLVTFVMARRYGFHQMTVADHAALYAAGAAPTAAQLDGAWKMDVISNANHTGTLAWLQFQNKPDGGFEARYQLLGIMEGLATPEFLMKHFQLSDFSPFHDEIRVVTPDLMVGKYVTTMKPAAAALFGSGSLGLFHTEAAVEGAEGRFGFYYLLSRAGKELPSSALLAPFLHAQLPAGIGMTFDETMEGWYWPGKPDTEEGRDGDLAIADKVPRTGDPPGTVSCSFRARVGTRDVNEFVDGYQHEATLAGAITFGRFEGQSPATFTMEEPSRFRYLRLNPATGEAEMTYSIHFMAGDRRFVLDAVKYMQKDRGVNPPAIEEVLNDFTSLFCRVHELMADGQRNAVGIAYLKFRTFENIAAVGNLAEFLGSLKVSGTTDPLVQFQARMRLIAFTAQFVQREYDPLAL